MPMYTVKKGDWLSKIAAAHKTPGGWPAIYNHPANAAFKKSHPNPDLIYPGDVIFVPVPPPEPPKKVEPPKVVKPPAAPVAPPPEPAKPPVKVQDPAPSSPKVAKPKSKKMDTSRLFDHQGGFRFRVELGGIAAGSFRSVEGLAVSVELIEYQGGGDMYARQIPGRPKISPVVLKKGYINTSILWDWMKANMEGNVQLEHVSIVLLTDDGQNDLARYELTDCWPSSWKGWQLDANASNAMVEEIELQVRGIDRVES